MGFLPSSACHARSATYPCRGITHENLARRQIWWTNRKRRSRSLTTAFSTATAFSKAFVFTTGASSAWRSTSAGCLIPRARSSSNLPWTQEEVCRFTCETVAANGLNDGYIRLVVTRGAGELGLNPYLCPKPSMFIIASTIKLYPDEHYQNGLSIITCATRRPAPGALDAPGEIAQLPQQHHGQGRGDPGQRAGSRDAQRTGLRGRVHRRQPVPHEKRHAATLRSSAMARSTASPAP